MQLLNLIITRGEKLIGYNCITKLPQLTLILLFKTSLEYIKTNEKGIRAVAELNHLNDVKGLFLFYEVFFQCALSNFPIYSGAHIFSLEPQSPCRTKIRSSKLYRIHSRRINS